MSERVFNFSAGPAMIFPEVLEEARNGIVDYNGTGIGVPELSHRGKDFIGIAEEAEDDLRKLMQIPEDYEVLFLQGGATGQFAAVPQNIGNIFNRADYVVNGEWGKKAYTEATKFMSDVHIAAKASPYTYVPNQQIWNLTDGADYVHITTNETINGVEFNKIPEVDATLVADMSSNILSKPMDVSKFGVMYAGAQKNIGPAGLTVVIANGELIGSPRTTTPSVLDWKKQAESDSMLNTPSTLAIYMAGLVFKHLKYLGGLDSMWQRNMHKSTLLYNAIDDSEFYSNPVETEYRSNMNVPFTLADAALESVFKQEAKVDGLVELGGHRSVGGLRASLYNAMPVVGVRTLIEFMKDFEQRYG